LEVLDGTGYNKKGSVDKCPPVKSQGKSQLKKNSKRAEKAERRDRGGHRVS